MCGGGGGLYMFSNSGSMVLNNKPSFIMKSYFSIIILNTRKPAVSYTFTEDAWVTWVLRYNQSQLDNHAR